MRSVILYDVPRHPQPSSSTPLPPEFTLHLGAKSSAQTATMARILRDLGAAVEVDAEGSLVAVRPEVDDAPRLR